MSFVSINPFNGVKNYSTPFISDDDLDKLLDNSKRAYLSWRKLPVEDRVKAVAKISELLSDNVEHLAATITKEMGKPIAEAEGEVKKVVTLVDYYVENAGEYWGLCLGIIRFGRCLGLRYLRFWQEIPFC